MKQIIELGDTERREMIAETFRIPLADLSQVFRFKWNRKNAGAICRMARENGGVKYTEGSESSKAGVLDSHGNITRVISSKQESVMQKSKILKHIDRVIFQVIVMGDNLTADDVLRLGNHTRLKKKLFMVDDMCRISMRRLSNSTSIFTVANYYYINSLCFMDRIRHYLGKLRTTAFRNMGIGEVSVVIADDVCL